MVAKSEGKRDRAISAEALVLISGEEIEKDK